MCWFSITKLCTPSIKAILILLISMYFIILLNIDNYLINSFVKIFTHQLTSLGCNLSKAVDAFCPDLRNNFSVLNTHLQVRDEAIKTCDCVTNGFGDTDSLVNVRTGLQQWAELLNNLVYGSGSDLKLYFHHFIQLASCGSLHLNPEGWISLIGYHPR